MKLNREAVQRMVSDRVGGGGGAGGGGGISIDDIQGMGFATQQWVDENYLSIAFFSSLFKAYTSEMVEVVPNGGDVSTIENIKAMFGFWTEQYVSSLGYNSSGGGGGGADLNLLLDNINDSNIGDIAPTASEVGKCLVYNGNNTWAWATPGGGITTVSVSSSGMLTGGSVSGTTLTLNTRSIQTPDVPFCVSFQNQTSYVAARLYNSDNLPSLAHSTYIEWWSSAGWYNHAMGHLILTDNSNQIWADTSGSKKFTLPSTSGTLATQEWVGQQGFVTSSGVTSVGLSMPQGFSVSSSPVTNSGTLSVSFANGYSLPTTAKQSNWDTAYGWGNHAEQGYLKKTEGMLFGTSDNYVPARFVLASGAYDSTRAAKAQGDGYIEWWSTGGYFNHEMGWIRAKGNVEVGTSTSDTVHYLQIGGGRIYWDNDNNALYVQKVDSQGNVTAANFYATGGVSSLGISSIGTPSISSMKIATLTSTTVNATTLNNSVIKPIDGYGPIIEAPYIEGNDEEDTYGVVFNHNTRNSHYLTDFYNIGLIGEDADKNETWSIEPNGSAVFASASVGSLKVGSTDSSVSMIYWDGTYLQVQIGTTTYKFRPDATA